MAYAMSFCVRERAAATRGKCCSNITVNKRSQGTISPISLLCEYQHLIFPHNAKTLQHLHFKQNFNTIAKNEGVGRTTNHVDNAEVNGGRSKTLKITDFQTTRVQSRRDAQGGLRRSPAIVVNNCSVQSGQNELEHCYFVLFGLDTISFWEMKPTCASP